jgi:hypothetical protein
MANLSLGVERQNAEARSSEIQCALRIRNEGAANIRLIWTRTSSATGSSVQRVLDSSLENDRKQLDELYRELNTLLQPVVDRKFGRGSQAYGSPFSRLMVSFLNFWRNRFGSGWRLNISHSSDAERYRREFVEGDVDRKDLNTVLRIKTANAERLEQRLGVNPASTAPSADAGYLADIEPQAEFSRNYVIRCKRRWFVTTSYAIDFDIQYQIADPGAAPCADAYVKAQPLYSSKSFTATVAPNPFFISLVAALFSVLGVLLKTSLDMLKNVDDLSWGVIEEMLGSGPMILALISAALTAVFFYNIYEWTELGRRIESGVGWRSALIIGGMSGLLNQKVVAALEDLFG